MKKSSPSVTPSYRACVAGGDTIMELRADVCPVDSVSLFFKFDLEGEKEEERRLSCDFDLSYFASAWSRGLLYYVISELGCSDRCHDMLLVWSETLYYHMDYVVRQLRVPGSSALRQEFFFKVRFAPTSSQAIENLGLPADCCGIGPTGGNLLDTVEPEDDSSLDPKDGACSICLDKVDYERRRGRRGEHLTHMPCSHVFHYNCLAEWLPKSNTCPLCRYQLKWKTFVSDL